MSGGTFDYLQFHIEEIVEVLKEYIWNYENAKNPNDLDYDIDLVNNRSEIDAELVKVMKSLCERLHRDFLWVEYLDKFLCGDISKEKFMRNLDIIRFESLSEEEIDDLNENL